MLFPHFCLSFQSPSCADVHSGLGAGFACENQSKKLFEFLSLSHIVQNYLVSSDRPASTLVTSMLVGFLVSLRSLTNINSNIQDFDLPDFVYILKEWFHTTPLLPALLLAPGIFHFVCSSSAFILNADMEPLLKHTLF